MNDVEERLKALENRVAKIKENKDWQEEYEKGKQQWNEERERLVRSNGATAKLREALLQLLEIDSSSSPLSPTKTTLNLEHNELAVNLSHSDKVVNMTTETVMGQVLYCALKKLPKEGFGEIEIQEAMVELGWNVVHNTLAPTLGKIVKSGYLVKIAGTKPTKYRLPQNVKMDIKGRD